MKKDELLKIIQQLKKYNLTESFKDEKEFDKWIKRLNKKQIRNFINLDIDPNKINFPIKFIINNDLLLCDDYSKRLENMQRIENNENWYMDSLFSLNFLNSKNYYKDLELIINSKNKRFALQVIDDDNFIHSKYHDEDLKLLLSIDNDNYKVGDALVQVATDENSINSSYHKEDMQLIAKCNPKSLQSTHTYPEYGVNFLAVDEVSLKDKYHLENMKILSKVPKSFDELYNLMTNEKIVNSKYYRDTINIIFDSKSKAKSVASLLYALPKVDEYQYSNLELMDYNIHIPYYLFNKNNLNGQEDPNYLINLKLLNELDDSAVIYYADILKNKKIIEKNYQRFAFNILNKIKDEDYIEVIYKALTNDLLLDSPYYMEDLTHMVNAKNYQFLILMYRLTVNDLTLNSPHHSYDMKFVSSLDKNITDDNTNKFYKISNYLEHAGIYDPNHIENLEKLLNGEEIIKENTVVNYINKLEEEVKTNSKVKRLSIFKRKNH